MKFLVGKKEKVVKSAIEPTGRFLYSEPMLWAASSIKNKPYSSHIFRNASRSAGCPAKSTTVIALVFSFIKFLTKFGSMFPVLESISQNLIRAPNCIAVDCVAINVIGGVITSSPGLRPIAAYAQ